MATSRRSWTPFLALGSLVLVSTSATPAPAQQPAWASLRAAPAARTRHALAFDSARGRAVLFGGWRTGVGNLGDTWEWDGTAWLRRTPATTPAARAGHAMAFDPVRGVSVLFGGDAAGLLDDTWEWDGDDWRHVVTANPPPPLEQPAMAWHGGGNPGILMFGGRTPFGPTGDTWRFDGTDWVIVASGTPWPRFGAAMAFVPTTSRTYLQGGWDGIGALSDHWAWDGNGWFPVTAGAQPMSDLPNQLAFHTMVFDAQRAQLVIVGGSDGTYGRESTYVGTLLGALQLAWTRAPHPTLPSGAVVPPGRVAAASAYDDVRRSVVTFGGQQLDANGAAGPELDATYLLPSAGAPDAWVRRLPLATAPPLRLLTAMEYDPSLQRTILFGGEVPGLFGDTWSFDGTAWTDHGGTSATPRGGHALAYWPGRGVVMSGGTTAAGLTAETLRWTGADWLPIATATAPPARQHARLVYDAARDRLVLFGGQLNTTVPFVLANDTWELRATTTFPFHAWQQRFPAHSPPARHRHAMTFDARRQRTVLFGGYQLYAALPLLTVPIADTWEYDGADWVQVVPATSPSEASNMTFDTARGVVMLIDRGSATWEYDGVAWTPRVTGTPAPANVYQRIGLTYDGGRQRVLAATPAASYSPELETWQYTAPIDRFAAGMSVGGTRLRCTKFPVAGRPIGFEFPSPDGYGWVSVFVGPAPLPGVVLSQPTVCGAGGATGSFFGVPAVLGWAPGTPARLDFVMSPAMAGLSFVAQGITLDLAGMCLRLTDPLVLTVAAP